jgi:hypothetical protein
MNKAKKEKLKTTLMKMASIVKYANECNLYSHELHFPNSFTEIHNNTFIESPDIDFLKYLTRNTIIIELNKLYSYSDKDKLSIPKLLKRFGNGNDLSDKEMFNFCNSIYHSFEIEKKTLLDDFKSLRDKVIAHTDFGVLETQNTIWDFLTNFKSLICFAADFICQVYKKVFEEDIPFNFDSTFYSKTNFELLTIFKNHLRDN